MQNKKQIIRNAIIFILLMALTFVLVFKNYDLEKTIDIILKVDYKYIILAIVAMFLNITFESLNIKEILKSLGKKTTLLKSIKYTLIGFFFSGITPGGGGGQPMEIYYMKKEKIPVNSSTLALLIEVCSFHIITIILGIIGLILNTNLLGNGFIWIFIIGGTFKLIILVVMLICLFSQRLSNFIVDVFLKFLTKIKYKNLDKITNEVNEFLEQYHAGSKFIKDHHNIFLKSNLIVFLQVICNYSITYFVYRSFGLNEYSFVSMIFIQALLIVSTSSIPLPGAVGISESAFLKIYVSVFGLEKLASAMLLSRGVNFYLFMIISLLVVVFNTIKKKKIINAK